MRLAVAAYTEQRGDKYTGKKLFTSGRQHDCS
jgi:hypothetical protein